MRRTLLSLPLVALSCLAHAQDTLPASAIASRVVDFHTERVSLHWKNDSGAVLGNLGALRTHVEHHGSTLLFGMNGGMFTPGQTPVGLYVEEGRMLSVTDQRTEGRGNFYLQPNGVFGLLKDGTPFVVPTAETPAVHLIHYATQSGPMLLVGGRINKLFTPGSENLHIRNGVGILADGRVLFAISRVPVNFHDFATWFLEQGCTNALYLDGAVSAAYDPSSGKNDLDGALGVLIAVTAR